MSTRQSEPIRQPVDLTERLFHIGTEAGYAAVPGLIWLLACLPVVTIGAATVGMFEVQLGHMARDQRKLVQPMFVAFKRDFKRATLSWLIVLVALILLAFNSYYYLLWKQPSVMSITLGAIQVLLIGLLVCLASCAYAITIHQGLGSFATLLAAARMLPNLRWWLAVMLLVVFAIPGLLVWLGLWPFLPFAGGTVSYIHAKVLMKTGVVPSGELGESLVASH